MFFQFVPPGLILQSNSEISQLGIRFPFGQHVPDDACHASHYRDSRDPRSFLSFDLFEPLPHRRIDPQNMPARLAQDPARHAAAGFGDVADTRLFSTFARAGS